MYQISVLTPLFFLLLTFLSVLIQGRPRAKPHCRLNHQNRSNVAETKILGGHNAVISDYPYTVQIRSAVRPANYLCGGAIVGHNKVVTAAHCAMKPGDHVIWGTDRLTGGGTIGEILYIYRHPLYQPTHQINDIAVIVLTDNYHGNARQIKLQRPTDPVPGHATIIGFGEVSYPGGQLADRLQAITVPVISLTDCRSALQDYPIFVNNICTLDKKDHGTCTGDSGSPVVSEDCASEKKLIGIVSYGIPCATGKPDVHASIAYYYDWLKVIL